jgi:cobalt/nickel transport protein
MNARLKNGLLITAVAALAILPLIIVKHPAAGPDGKQVEIFKGADDQASTAIQVLAPGYKPWFKSIYKSPSPEIDTLLFALQAAIGAGFIGYYVGYSRGRAKDKRAY